MPSFTYDQQPGLFRHERDRERHYRYDDARQYCASLGMHFLEDWMDGPDKVFHAAHFTQEQVNVAMREHAIAVQQLFNPKAYNWRGRIALALHFLFGIA